MSCIFSCYKKSVQIDRKTNQLEPEEVESEKNIHDEQKNDTEHALKSVHPANRNKSYMKMKRSSFRYRISSVTSYVTLTK